MAEDEAEVELEDEAGLSVATAAFVFWPLPTTVALPDLELVEEAEDCEVAVVGSDSEELDEADDVGREVLVEDDALDEETSAELATAEEPPLLPTEALLVDVDVKEVAEADDPEAVSEAGDPEEPTEVDNAPVALAEDEELDDVESAGMATTEEAPFATTEVLLVEDDCEEAAEGEVPEDVTEADDPEEASVADDPEVVTEADDPEEAVAEDEPAAVEFAEIEVTDEEESRLIPAVCGAVLATTDGVVVEVAVLVAETVLALFEAEGATDVLSTVVAVLEVAAAARDAAADWTEAAEAIAAEAAELADATKDDSEEAM